MEEYHFDIIDTSYTELGSLILDVIIKTDNQVVYYHYLVES